MNEGGDESAALCDSTSCSPDFTPIEIRLIILHWVTDDLCLCPTSELEPRSQSHQNLLLDYFKQPSLLTMSKFLLTAATAAATLAQAKATCLSNSSLNDFFVNEVNDGNAIPQEGSCCMADVCGLACPVPVSEPANGVYYLMANYTRIS